MELGESETFRVFNHHNRGVGNIDAHFDDNRGNQHLDLIVIKTFHNPVFFLLFHGPVQQRGLNAFEPSAQFLIQLFRRFHIQRFRFVDERRYHIGLPSFLKFLFHKIITGVSLTLINGAGCNFLPSRRKLVNDGNIQISIQDHRQGPWNRCRGHNQHMGVFPFFGKSGPLVDAEPVLLVGNDKPQFVKDHIRLNNRVGPD